MAGDKAEARESYWSQWFPCMVLFRGFRLAFDFNKIILAVAGLLVMALLWWLLAAAFFTTAGDRPSFKARLESAPTMLPERDDAGKPNEANIRDNNRER